MFILHKSSKVYCTTKVANQCKEFGHKEYDYEIKLCTAEVLDKRGFIIDHMDIHTLVKRVFKTKMASCELLSQSIGIALKKKMDRLKVPVIRIEVCIKPVNSNAHMTYIKEYKK